LARGKSTNRSHARSMKEGDSPIIAQGSLMDRPLWLLPLLKEWLRLKKGGLLMGWGQQRVPWGVQACINCAGHSGGDGADTPRDRLLRMGFALERYVLQRAQCV
jgi:hypothetical protein